LRDLPHERGSLHANLASKYRPESNNPEPDAFVADINSALMERTFDIPKLQGKTDLQHHRKLNDLG
jgi:hypothetical protein